MEAATRATDRIMAAAVQIYGERAPELITLDEIALRAKLSKGLVVYHFGSLDSLITTLKAYLVFRLRLIWMPELPETLDTKLAQWATVMEEEPELFRLYVNMASRSGKKEALGADSLLVFREEFRSVCEGLFIQVQLPDASQQAALFSHWWEGMSMRCLAEEDRAAFVLSESEVWLRLLAGQNGSK